jgi:cytochrome b561
MAYAAGRTRYTTVAIWLHWLIAGLLLFNLATGLTFSLMPDSWFGALIGFHISSGITVLALTAVRIVWRLTHRPPPMLPMPAWQKALANAVYLFFYLGMVAAPMTGWILISAHADKPPVSAPATAKPVAPGTAPAPKPHRTLIWGLIPLPKLAPVQAIGNQPGGEEKLHEVHEQFEGRHGTIGWILLALLVLHVSGALKHQLIDRRRELGRMGVGRPEPA